MSRRKNRDKRPPEASTPGLPDNRDAPDTKDNGTSAGAPEGADDALPHVLVRHAHRLALGLLTLLIFYWFYPEIRYASIFYNDAVSHSAIIKSMDLTWNHGGNITDFWMDYINMGHALLRSYQFLFHLTIWIIHKTILSWLSLNVCFNVCITLMALLLPWCIYKGCRLLGMNRAEAVLTAVGVCMLHERDGYGLGLTNFTYSGYGTYNQLFAMLFMPFAIAYSHRLLVSGKGVIRAALLFSATFMAHILTGYFACVWILIDTLFTLATRRREIQLKRALLSLLAFGGLVLLLTGHWVIPMAQDTLLQHKSEFEGAWKWTGHGAEKMLGDFASGLIMDADRWYPALTILSAIGMLYCAIPWFGIFKSGPRQSDRQLLRRQLFIQGVVWTCLTFGPMTWGPILKVLPFSGALHWHRFFAGAELAFMMCSGMLLAGLVRRLDLRNNQLHLGATGVLATLLLLPCVWERQVYFYVTNTYWLIDTYQKWEYDSMNFHRALNFALEHPNARYYVGSPWNWGNKMLVSGTIPFYAVLVQNNVETVGAIHHHQNHSEVLAFRSNIFNAAQAELMNVRYVGIQTPSQIPLPDTFKQVATMANAALYDTGNTSGFFAVGPIGQFADALEKPPCVDGDSLGRTVTYYVSTTLPERHVYPPMALAGNCEGKPQIEELVSRLATLPAEPLPGSIVKTSIAPGTGSDVYSATVNMTAPGLVLFKMNYHPGWKALVDGAPAPTLMVVPSMTAIRLGPGTHELRLSYEVAPVKRALLWLSLATLLGLGAHGAWRLYGSFSGRRFASPASPVSKN